MDEKPRLTLVDGNYTANDDEFLPLPHFSWDERPRTLPLDSDECATAIHLSKGDIIEASSLLKIDDLRLRRFIKASPRLQRIFDEALGGTIAKARSIPIRTLWDPNADHRRLEWASTKILQSRAAQGDPLSPAPAASLTTVPANEQGTLILKWGDAPADDDNGSPAPTGPSAA